MKPIIWLLIFLIWMVLGYFIASKFICGVLPAAAAVPAAGTSCSTWEVEDGNLSFSINNNIRFLRNSAQHLSPFTDVNNGVTQIANHLINNTNRNVTVTGFYDSNEANISSGNASNLGMARAADISSWLTSLGVPAGQISTKSEQRENCYRQDTLIRGAWFSFEP